MPFSHLFRIPKPKSFLYLMSLRTGTELIILTFLVNKLTGFYGLLALLTGLHLSNLQLSMYIYSLVALFVGATLAPHIRRGAASPFQTLSLAWLYLADSAINAAYTAAFGASWFAVLAHHAPAIPDTRLAPGSGGAMINDAAGFSNPSFTVSAVDVVMTSAAVGGVPPTQEAALLGHAEGALQPAHGATNLAALILQTGSLASVITIAALWVARIYFMLVISAYARSILRQYIVAQAQASFSFPSTTEHSNGSLYANNPFAVGTPAGDGWRGRLGRLMVGIGRGYWLGVDESQPAHLDSEESRSLGTKLALRRLRASEDSNGTVERERRRRAGTGPTVLKPIELEDVRKSG